MRWDVEIHLPDQGMPNIYPSENGQFKSFTEAKNYAIKGWREDVRELQYAIKELIGMRKQDFINSNNL